MSDLYISGQQTPAVCGHCSPGCPQLQPFTSPDQNTYVCAATLLWHIATMETNFIINIELRGLSKCCQNAVLSLAFPLLLQSLPSASPNGNLTQRYEEIAALPRPSIGADTPHHSGGCRLVRVQKVT